MSVCQPGGSLVSRRRRSCGLVFLAFSLSFAADPAWAQDDQVRRKSALQPPAEDANRKGQVGAPSSVRSD